MRFFLQNESEQLGRLTSEMQAQLAETVDLLEKTAFNVARPLPRPNPYVLRADPRFGPAAGPFNHPNVRLGQHVNLYYCNSLRTNSFSVNNSGLAA